MLIIRKQYSENILGNTYYPAQIVNNTLHNTIGYTEDALDVVGQSKIGQVPPVRKKTRMVRNVISGIKGYVSDNKSGKKNLKNKKRYVHSS